MPDKLPVNDVVVLLPGILGSVLERDGEEVWAISRGAVWRGIVTLGRSVRDLRIVHDDPAAPDLGDGVRATRLMPDIHLVPGLWKIDGYGKVKDRLFQQFDLVEGVNWFEFPYDWRRDNRAAAQRLAEQAPRWLEEFRRRSGKQDAKLVLLGHSMGGLVARHFLEVLNGWEMTRALVTFGTPYRGSINALDFLANGFRKGIGPFKIDLSDLLRSLTSVYQLLPTYRCIDDGSGSLKKIVDAAGLPAAVVHEKVAAAVGFHDDIAAAVQLHGGYGRYQIFPIVGIFQPTRQSAVVRNDEVDILFELDGNDIGGDGTVPRPSATPLELSDEAREVYATESHASLQNFDPVLVQVAGVLTWEPLALYKGRPADGFRLEVDDVVPPHEPFDVTLGTAGPVLNVAAAAVNVDTGTRVEATARLASDGRATVTLPGLSPGVYRITGWDADDVGLKPVNDLVIVADEPSAEREAATADDPAVAGPTA
jgi:pimeloyl-ACP methyl ester carboxylesterase